MIHFEVDLSPWSSRLMRAAHFAKDLVVSSICAFTPQHSRYRLQQYVDIGLERLIADVSGAAYQASKRGVLGMAHAIRMEEKQNGIRTSVICPGLVNTELLEQRPVKPSPEVLAQALLPEDVAETILHVAKLPPRASIPELQLMPTSQ